MFNNTYLLNLYKDLETKSSNETEYLQAVYEFFKSLDLIIDEHKEFEESNLIGRIIEPERLIQFRVPWHDDKGQIHVNRGFRVEFNSAIGPYKGGLRFHPSVNASIIKFLGFEQTIKNALTTLPMGGGKGGSDFNPKGKSDYEIMRFCHSFINELYRHIGPHTDVPAGDMGVGAREIGYMFGQYKKLTNQFDGTFTGKGLTFGGSLIRKQATGYGLCYFVEEALQTIEKTGFSGKKVIISGSGNVALYAAEKAIELGATVIAMSDSSGIVYDPKGIDINKMIDLKEVQRKRINSYTKLVASAVYEEGANNIWKFPCDIALPCATQNELSINEAKLLVDNGVRIVAEGANMPCSLEAIEYFKENNVIFAPGKAANAGGVLVSGLEMSQNASFFPWTSEKVDETLKTIMREIFHNANNTASKYGFKYDLEFGANVAGFLKVAQAMLAQGVV